MTTTTLQTAPPTAKRVSRSQSQLRQVVSSEAVQMIEQQHHLEEQIEQISELHNAQQIIEDKLTRPYNVCSDAMLHDHRLLYEVLRHHAESLKGKVPLSLIVTRVTSQRESPVVKTLMNVVAQVAVSVKHEEQFLGRYHLGVTLGNLKLDWLCNSLVNIREADSSVALFCIHVTVLQKNLPTILNLLASYIVLRNLKDQYDPLKNNCHHFAHQLFDLLGIDFFKTPIKNKLLAQKVQAMKTSITDFDCSIPLEHECLSKQVSSILKETARRANMNPSSSFTHSSSNCSSYKVTSHQELDIFVSLLRSHPEYKNHLEEFEMVEEIAKGYDRAFWMRFMYRDGSKVAPETTPMTSFNGDCLCPFGSPYDLTRMKRGTFATPAVSQKLKEKDRVQKMHVQKQQSVQLKSWLNALKRSTPKNFLTKFFFSQADRKK